MNRKINIFKVINYINNKYKFFFHEIYIIFILKIINLFFLLFYVFLSIMFSILYIYVKNNNIS